MVTIFGYVDVLGQFVRLGHFVASYEFTAKNLVTIMKSALDQ